MAHTESHTPSPAAPRGLQSRLLGLFLEDGVVLETAPIAARMLRVRIAAKPSVLRNCLPGQQIRLATGDPHADWLLTQLGDVRTYSLWEVDADAGWFDLCLLDHGDGPGARWSRTVEPGQPVRFRAPEGSFVLRPNASYHLFAGEETAAVAFGAILRAVPEDVRVYGAVETATAADRLPLPRAAELTHPLRGEASAAASELLLTTVAELELPAEPGVAYLAGEARTIQMVARHLVRDRKWPRKSVVTKPFWTPGKRGLE